MFEVLASSGGSTGPGIALIIGVAILAGTLGAWLFKKLRIPGIVGYVTVGIFLGPVLDFIGVGFITDDVLNDLMPFNMFALGIIGFLLGGELKRDIFVRFGRQVIKILLFSGLLAFFLVGVLTFLVTWYFRSWQMGLSLGLVFGAICSATDPASTINVIWETKSRGPVSSMLTTIVALGDALAILLYMNSVAVVSVLIGGGNAEAGVGSLVLWSLWEILGSVGIGMLGGFAVRWLIIRRRSDEGVVIFTLGGITALVGLAGYLELDVILAAISMGIVMVNYSPRQTAKSFELTRRLAPVIYIMFFVMTGARMDISGLGGVAVILAVIYILGSLVGKTVGAYAGAFYSSAVPSIRKNLGWCLYPQGTMAVALLLMASARFDGPIQETMIAVIIVGMFVLQVIGPISTTAAMKRAGEAGLNIREQDLIIQCKVGDVMNTDVPVIEAGQLISEVIRVIGGTRGAYYCVVDHEHKLIGALTVDGIRQTFTTQEINDWLVALDVMEHIAEQVTPDTKLIDAMELSQILGIQYMPVVDSLDSSRFMGILDIEAVHRNLQAQVLTKQQEADKMAGLRTI